MTMTNVTPVVRSRGKAKAFSDVTEVPCQLTLSTGRLPCAAHCHLVLDAVERACDMEPTGAPRTQPASWEEDAEPEARWQLQPGDTTEKKAQLAGTRRPTSRLYHSTTLQCTAMCRRWIKNVFVIERRHQFVVDVIALRTERPQKRMAYSRRH